MIRDTRRINIQTNFFDDDYDFEFKPHQQTFETNLHSKEKGAMALFYILDTIRLHRIISSFNSMVSLPPRNIRKYSSKMMLQRDLNLHKKSYNQQNEQYNQFKENVNEEGSDYGSMKGKYQPKFLNRKRSQSANATFTRESQFLRQSRKRILEGISKKLDEQSKSRVRQNSRERRKPVSNGKLQGKFQGFNEQQETHKFKIESRENLKINHRLQKLQHLMKNIRREKQKQQPIRIHQKKQVSHLPKKEKNHQQMRLFLQEIHSLRKEVQEVKQLNQTILRHSRQRSLRSSSAAKSQRQDRTYHKQLHLEPVKNIKKSQVLDARKYGKIITANKSQKVCAIKMPEETEQRKQENFSPRQRILSHRKQNRKNTEKAQIKNTISQKKKTKQLNKQSLYSQPQVIEIIQDQQLQPIASKQKQKPQPRTSSRQRLKREPSLTQSQDQLKNNQIILTNQNLQYATPEPVQQPKMPKIKPDWNKQQAYIKITNQDQANNYNNQAKETRGNGIINNTIKIEESLDVKKNNINNNNISDMEHKQKAWYKLYGQPQINYSQFNKKSITSNLGGYNFAVGTQNAGYQTRYNQNYLANISSSTYPNASTNNFNSKFAISVQYPKLETNKQQQQSKGSLQNLYALNKPGDAVSSSNPNSCINSPNNINTNITNNAPYNYSAYSTYTHIEDNKHNNSNNEHYNYNNYDANYITNYRSSSIKKHRQQDSGYTNPDLLKQLNITPFPKPSSSTTYSIYGQDKSNIDTNGYRYTNNKLISLNAYEQTSKVPSHHNTNEYNINLTPITYPHVESIDKVQSNYTLEDNSQYGSYTYSKGSSAVTSMNKLEQEYNYIINNQQINDHNTNNHNTASYNYDINQHQGQDTHGYVIEYNTTPHSQPYSYQNITAHEVDDTRGGKIIVMSQYKHNKIPSMNAPNHQQAIETSEGYHYQYKSFPTINFNNQPQPSVQPAPLMNYNSVPSHQISAGYQNMFHNYARNH